MRGKLKSFSEREQIRKAVENTGSQRQAAKALAIARETVRKYAPKKSQGV